MRKKCLYKVLYFKKIKDIIHKIHEIYIQTSHMHVSYIVTKDKFLFVSLSICVSRHHVYISARTTFILHIQPHSKTRKVFACFPTQASFSN